MIVHLLLRRRKRILSAILQGIPFLGSFNSYKGFCIPDREYRGIEITLPQGCIPCLINVHSSIVET